MESDNLYYRITYLLVVASVMSALLGLYLCSYYALGVPFSIGYGEGPILNQAAILAEGGNIYPPQLSASPHTISNYGPLYPALQAALISLFGPSFLIGRIISIISGVITVSILFIFIRRQTKDLIAATVASSLFLSHPIVLRWIWTGRVDMLALALYASTLFVVMRKSRKALFFASILTLSAIYTRQTYLFASIFSCTALLLYQKRKRELPAFLLMTIALGAVLFLLLEILTGGGFSLHTIHANINSLAWGRLYVASTTLLALFPIGSAVVIYTLLRDRTNLILSLLLLFSAAPSMIAIIKIGSMWNYLLEIALAFSIIIGLFLGTVRDIRVKSLCVLALAFQCILSVSATGQKEFWTTEPRYWYEHKHEVLELINQLGKIDKPVLSDNLLGFEVLNNERIVFQPFIMTQLAKQKLWEQDSFLEKLEKKEFGAIVIFAYYREHPKRDRWTEQMLAHIKSRYFYCTTIAENSLLLPRDDNHSSLKEKYCPHST